MVGDGAAPGAVETWPEFLRRGAAVPPQLAEAVARSVSKSDPGALFFSSGSAGVPKGILSAHRGVARCN
jgi:fatty-acyl-CoA synthase